MLLRKVLTMRERLIELLNKKYDHFCDQCGVNKDSRYTDSLADYLIENGVVVPPCKVGDTLYHIGTCITAEDFGKNYIDFGKVNKIEISKYGECIFLDTGCLCSLDAIDETVFLSREEAERALKGGE